MFVPPTYWSYRHVPPFIQEQIFTIGSTVAFDLPSVARKPTVTFDLSTGVQEKNPPVRQCTYNFERAPKELQTCGNYGDASRGQGRSDWGRGGVTIII